MKDIIFGLLYILMIISLISCEDNSTNVNGASISTISITLNGGGYVNNTYSIESVLSKASYDTMFNVTNCNFVPITQDYLQEINLSFSNHRPGIYNWSGPNSLSFVLDSIKSVGKGRYWFSNPAGVTKISEYGDVGGMITGVFEGTIITLTLYGSDSISVKGEFSINRIK
jgi:hypothetical protein